MSIERYFNYLIKPVRERKFIYSSYEDFLKKISHSNKYQIVPLKDFLGMKSDDRVIISLRHDVDLDLSGALEMARIEHKHHMKATYFILHTAKYYGQTKKNYVRHNENIIPILQKIQDIYGHEIGWHNDLVTLDCIYDINPKKYLKEELEWLRNNGIDVIGTAPHGSKYCHKFKYYNNYFFKEFPEIIENFSNNESIVIGDNQRFITKANLNDFNLEYEAYHLDNNLYFSDCSFIGKNKKRWHPGDLNLEDLTHGDKIIITIHPIHWGYSVTRKYLKLLSIFTRTLR